MPIKRSRLSTDWIPFRITPYGDATTVTVSSVQMAVTPNAEEPTASGVTSWQTVTQIAGNGGAVVEVALMVGPNGGAIDPGTAGSYTIWLRYADGARNPVVTDELQLT
jgi:hypothetical protein